MTFLNKLNSALLGKIFARWHLAIAITSILVSRKHFDGPPVIFARAAKHKQLKVSRVFEGRIPLTFLPAPFVTKTTCPTARLFL